MKQISKTLNYIQKTLTPSPSKNTFVKLHLVLLLLVGVVLASCNGSENTGSENTGGFSGFSTGCPENFSASLSDPNANLVTVNGTPAVLVSWAAVRADGQTEDYETTPTAAIGSVIYPGETTPTDIEPGSLEEGDSVAVSVTGEHIISYTARIVEDIDNDVFGDSIGSCMFTLMITE